MKRLFMVLLVIVYVTTVLLSAILPVVKAEGAQHEELPGVETGVESEGESGGENGGLAALQAAWMTYIDFTTAQMEAIFDDPSIYMGYEAVFDVECWSNFQYAANPAVSFPGEEENLIDDDELVDAEGNRIRVKINDYATDAEGKVWYRIEAAQGYTLPQLLVDNPYIMHISSIFDIPSLIILPMKGMFLQETVEIKKQPGAAEQSVILPAAELPLFFDVLPVGVNQEFFDLGDTTGWHDELAEKGYHYVDEACVYLIAPEVTVAYEKLQQATSAKEYNEIWESIPESVRQQFTEQHLTVLDERQEELNNVTYSQTVMYNGKELGVSVSGPIPEQGVTLHVGAVSGEDILNGGFDVKSATDIITALDIKLLREDSSEWQPEDGQYVELNIGMAELGVPDGTVVRLHHKHEDKINVQEVFVVMNGKLNILTSGFSIYVVDNTTDTTGNQVQNNAATSVAVGDTIVLYDSNNQNGTWIVEDSYGAIHYTVHSNNDSSESIGHNQVRARWIKIVGLKETSTPIKLTFSRGNNNDEVCYLNVTVPRAAANQKKLYIKDEVNTTGCLVAAVVDQNGNEVSLEGAAFSWERDDGLFIVPSAYEREYKAVNIARDHGGLVEARKKDDGSGYQPTTYKLDVILADGTELSASYTVYYQSEIINAGFEFPNSANRNYSFFPNGYPELYWKTTAPGTGTGNITKDIEYGDVTGLNANSAGETDYGVWRAADWETGGTQFAELNAEEVGALYQDIITAPHEDIEWDFAHAKRPNQSWASNVQNKMYLVIGATETAQKLTNAQLNTLVREARQKAGNNTNFLTCKEPYKLTFSVDGAEYWVWYHDADNQTNYSQAANYGWANLSGSYEVPDNQYRTRIFFVSDPDSNSSNKNAGNVIDRSSAGQYKSYLIEYYEQTYETVTVDGETVSRLKTVRFDDYEESGEALIYSSVLLKNYEHFIVKEHDYLYKILINGGNYPYDLRYASDPDDPDNLKTASLYIEKYPGTPTDPLGENKDYSQYDIVMQIFLRDTVVAVQKVLEFPTKLENPEEEEGPDNERIQLLTEEQKLTIMENLNKDGGYKATFSMDLADDTDPEYAYHQVDSAVITNRDPAGNYKGFVALGENPELKHQYTVQETAVTEIPGLILDTVTFGVTRYSMGQQVNDEDKLTFISYDEVKVGAGEPLVCTPFTLEGTIKIADVVVTNTYREKETTIYYKAVGSGKVALTGMTNFEDVPTEQLAFYSGKAVGADVHTSAGATFAGWFKDEACTVPVTAADGVYDKNTGNFKPNANIINADEVTFYAKFTTGTIIINRTGANAGQSFVYHVTGKTTTGKDIDLYLTLVCGEDGDGSAQVLEVLDGTYTITEVDSWSWRHTDGGSKTVTHKGSQKIIDTVTFTGSFERPNWLSGLAEITRNIFKGVVTP